MPLHILHSNRVEQLLDNLSGEISEPHEKAGVLDGETILLDNPVLGKWLNLQLAMQNTVVANISYVPLNDFFWQLSRDVVSSEIPRTTPLCKEEMTWRLLHLLQDKSIIGKAELEPVRKYLGVDEEGSVDDENKDKDFLDLKRYQLADSVADLFDQYLVYRPDWINSCWDKGTAIKGQDGAGTSSDAEKWQKVLWSAMREAAGSHENLSHRAGIFKTLCSDLNDKNKDSKSKLKHKRLFVFGVTSMPGSHLDMLMSLARHIDVYLYLLNPCEMEWFDIRSARTISRLAKWEQTRRRAEEQGIEITDGVEGLLTTHLPADAEQIEIGNPLLAGQGEQVRDFLNLVFTKIDQYLEDSKIRDDMQFISPDPNRDTSLLSSIQQDIHDLKFRGEVAQYAEETGSAIPLPTGQDISSPSIHIHNCHSPLREVEVLHDQLLNLFQNNPTLNPRDVVVMMPRVAPYVPYIKSVFESAIKENTRRGQAARKKIDYHITDRTLVEESPILNSFETLMKLPESRLPLSEVLGLLELPSIHQKFGLDRGSYEILKKWLIDSGARWGLNEEHRKKEVGTSYREFSWAFGKDRMFAGYTMQADDQQMPLDVLPLDEIEGSNAETLDGFLKFWNKLEHYRTALSKDRSPEEWRQSLRKMLEDFYKPEEEDRSALDILGRGIDEIAKASSKGWYEERLPLEVVRARIQPVLKQAADRRHPWSEGVKFCSLLPMRGVPFKVVYLLGMNMEDYPRRIEMKSFDLMRNDLRPGDRSARTDDRWLFLEALLSARQAFHVSYIGQDMHRNEPREPSVVVSELIDYIRDGYSMASDGHPEIAGEDPAWPKDIFKENKLNKNSFLYTKHPLQPFSADYFREDSDPGSRLLSYNKSAFSIVKGQLAARGESEEAGKADLDDGSAPIDEFFPSHPRWEPPEDAKFPGDEVIEVSLEEFVSFFAKPWGWFFREKGVSLNRYDDEVSDEELWNLQEGLGDWKMCNRLLERVNRDELDMEGHEDEEVTRDWEVAALVREQRAKGAWPLGANGQKAANKLKELSPEFVFFLARDTSNIRQILAEKTVCFETNGQQSEVTLRVVGDSKFYGNGLRIQSASKAKGKTLVDFYVRTVLAAHAFSHPQINRPHGITDHYELRSAKAAFKPKIEESLKINDQALPLEFGDEMLADFQRHDTFMGVLAELYLSFMHKGLPFDPDISLQLSNLKKDKQKEYIEQQWFGSGYGRDRCIKANLAERTYFSSPEAMASKQFQRVARKTWDAIVGWSTGQEVDHDK